MQRIGSALGLVATIGAVSTAHEGPRFWIGNVGGRITTFTSDDDLSPTVYTHSRIFVTEFQQFFGIYTTEFPGYEVRTSGGNVGTGRTFGFNIAGPALYFDEVDEVFVTTQEMFGPPGPGPVPQLAVSLSAQLRSTSSGAVSGFNFFTFNGPGDHSHLAYTLLGDGSTAGDGPAGVYALPLVLTSGGLVSSEPYYLLIGKEVAVADDLFQCALGVAHATLAADGPLPTGDYDLNGVVNTDDYEFWPNCMTGPLPMCLGLGCWAFDTDAESDVDLRDYSVFQRNAE